MERQKDKILIVDDVELNRAILCELFAGDYEILEADNGKTAVDLMEQPKNKSLTGNGHIFFCNSDFHSVCTLSGF